MKTATQNRTVKQVGFTTDEIKNPRPHKLTPEFAVARAIKYAPLILSIAVSNRACYTGASKTSAASQFGPAVEVAIDLVARMIEVGAHLRYDPRVASVDSWIVGFARMTFRKSEQDAAKRRARTSGGDPSAARSIDKDRINEEDRAARLKAFVRRLTPVQAEVFALISRVGPSATRISSATGMSPGDVAGVLRGIRGEAAFIGLAGKLS